MGHHTVLLTAVVLFLVSPHPHPYTIQPSPATLTSHSDLKVSWVHKTSTHWYQWFRGSAMLSKRNIFASFINQSKPTEYSFTLHLSQHLITKSTSMPPPRTLFSFCRGCHEQALYETETHHLNCNILCRIRKQKTLLENLHLQWNWLLTCTERENRSRFTEEDARESQTLCKSNTKPGSCTQ